MDSRKRRNLQKAGHHVWCRLYRKSQLFLSYAQRFRDLASSKKQFPETDSKDFFDSSGLTYDPAGVNDYIQSNSLFVRSYGTYSLKTANTVLSLEQI